MQIVCPSCNARYLAPDDQIGPNGRRVRCARCSHVWRAVPPEPEPDAESAAPPDSAEAATAEAAKPPPAESPSAEPPSAEPASAGSSGLRVEPLPRNRLPAPADAHKRRAGFGFGWALFAMVVGALAAALYFGRATVVEVWPPAIVLYEAVGLDGDAAQVQAVLDVKRIEHKWDGDDMVLSGEVENASAVAAPPQYIRIKLLDGEGSVVSDQRQALGDGEIGPGETRAFAMRFKNPGDVARALPLVEPIR